jgi:hypothetical protein
VNNNNVIVAVTFPRSEMANAVEFEFDTETLMNLGEHEDRSSLLGIDILSEGTALQILAMNQTVDDLQQLVWP